MVYLEDRVSALEEEIEQLKLDFAGHRARYPENAGTLAVREKKSADKPSAS